ncbi:hypothetical protein SANTM175S_03295 [Streptomyces antimycoticus]
MAHFSTPDAPRFSVEVYQNEYLPEGGHEVNAIITVTSSGGGAAAGGPPIPAPAAAPDVYDGIPATYDGVPGAYDGGSVPGGAAARAAVVIMVDCSGSMDYPPTKMRHAREATAAAIDTVRDGVAFSVVAGTHKAVEVFPGNGQLAIADPLTRAQAKEALRSLSPGGGTAIGTWLLLADLLLGSADATIRHGILLTDGRNEHEEPARAAARRLRGPLHLRRPRGGHRLGGRGGHRDRLRPARHGRYRRRSRRTLRGLHADDGGGDGQGDRRRQPPAVDPQGRRGGVCETGRTDGRGSDRPPRRGRSARGRLSHRVLGR